MGGPLSRVGAGCHPRVLHPPEDPFSCQCHKTPTLDGPLPCPMMENLSCTTPPQHQSLGAPTLGNCTFLSKCHPKGRWHSDLLSPVLTSPSPRIPFPPPQHTMGTTTPPKEEISGGLQTI